MADFVIVHGRFSGFQPENWIAADILGIKDGILVKREFAPLLGGGLEPAFRVLSFAIFLGVPSRISIRVETCGK